MNLRASLVILSVVAASGAFAFEGTYHGPDVSLVLKRVGEGRYSGWVIRADQRCASMFEFDEMREEGGRLILEEGECRISATPMGPRTLYLREESPEEGCLSVRGMACSYSGTVSARPDSPR